jgi:serine/threonine protein phosphatase PrpC
MVGVPPAGVPGQAPANGGDLPDGWIRAELAALSACGPVREQNEDRLGWAVLGDALSIVSPGSDEGPVTAHLAAPGLAIVVADGLGGHSHGELASRTAVGMVLRRLVAPDAGGKAGQVLRTGFEEANEACLMGRLVDPVAFDRSPATANPVDDPAAGDAEATGRDAGLRASTRGGQTTLSAVALTGRTGNVAHVGDSRIYRLRDGMIELLTNDHTQVRELIRMRVIKPEQALTHPGRHLLTRSIGGDLIVRIEERASAPAVGDVYLLCTDGLWSTITSWEAQNAMSGNLGDGVAALVRRSAEVGGDDNASVIALRVTDLGGRPDLSPPAGWRFPWRR